MAEGFATQAIQTDFGGIVQQGANIFAQQKEQRRLEAERADKKRLDFEDRYGIDESLFNLEDTEFRTINDATTEGLSMARDRYYDVFKALEQDPTNVDLKKRLGKIKGFVTNMGKSHEKMLALGEDYLTKIQNDEISGVDEKDWQTNLEATDEGRISINMDADDNMQILFYDKDGKLADVKPYKELLGGSLIKKIDVDAEVDAIVESIGGHTKDTITGDYIRTEQVYGELEQKTVTEQIDGQLEDDDIMADLLNQITGGESMKKKDFTEADYTKVQNYLHNQVRGRYSTKSSIKANQVALTDRRIAAARATAKAKGESTDKIKLGLDDQGGGLMRDNKVIYSYAGGVQLDAAKTGTSFDEIRLDKDGRIELAGEKKIKIKGIQATEDLDTDELAERTGKDKRLLTKVSNGGGTYTYYESQENVTKDEKDIAKFANVIGADDVEGLRAVLEGRSVEKFGQENYDAFRRGEITNEPKAEKDTKGSNGMG